MGNHEIKSDIEKSVNSADRLKAVVDAYWSMSDPRSSDMNFLRETLRNKLEIQDPSDAQLKIVFDYLPARIIGIIIAWGLNDSVVQEDISELVDRNKSEILSACNIPPHDHKNN